MKLKTNKKLHGDIVFKAVVGSHAHGTNIPESDIDIKGVYIQSANSVLVDGYKPQIDVTDDEVYYEIRRFIELCCTANPTVLELLYSPEDMIEYKNPVFDMLLEKRDMFLTKSCKHSFGGYATSQIRKASGLQKKMNWKKEDMVRKSVLDFCYTIVGYDSKPFLDSKWANLQGAFAQNNNGKGVYCFFADVGGLFNFREKTGEDSNSLRHQKIPKEWFDNYNLNDHSVVVWFDIDSYSRHCRRYREYNEWLEKRNTQRYVDVNEHGQQIDGKNMLHCVRLIEMGKEVAEGKGFNVRRYNAEFLISIRKGKVSLKDLLDRANTMIAEMDELYEKSTLPEKCDKDFFKDLLIKIREQHHTFSLGNKL